MIDFIRTEYEFEKARPFTVQFAKKNKLRLEAEEWTAEHKLDGHRRLLIRATDGSLHAYGRRLSVKTGKRENVISEMGASINGLVQSLPLGTAIDAEVVWPGKAATDVPTAMKHCPDELRCFGFGLPWLRGNQHAPGSRTALLERLEQLGVPLAPSWNLAALLGRLGSPVDDEVWFEAAEMKLIEIARTKGMEGYILKRQPGDQMAKVKVLGTYDVIVTGTTEAKEGKTGKWKGLIGALVCSAYNKAGELVEVTQCSGMTDDERRRFTAEKPIGQVIEVEANEVTKYGKLKHPRFVRIRDDKNARECLVPTIPGSTDEE